MSYQQPYQQQGQQYGQQDYQQQQYQPHQGYNQQQQPQYGQQQPQYGQQQQQGQPQQYNQHSQHATPGVNQTPTAAVDQGSFHGGSYSINHRDTNSVLTVTLQPNATVKSVSGAMIHMSASIVLAGKIKFSMRKMFTGSEMSESTYTGPGVVALAPTLPGDIFTLPIDGSVMWKVGKDAWLGCTQDVRKEARSQGIGKALFSGEDLFVYNVVGQGLAWLTSFGAVEKLDMSLPLV